MSATNQDRITAYKDGQNIVVPVKGATVIRAGVIACVDASGLAVEGATSTTLTYLGRFEAAVDNTAGADGAVSVPVLRRKAFKWDNLAADAVTQASVGKSCYIADNQTVAATNGGNTRSAAGIVIALDADGVWVQ